MTAGGLGSLALALLLAYLAGSFPTSILVGRLFFGVDPRTRGSGNAGGTNSFRVFGWKAGVAVVVVDVGKGALAALLIAPIGASSGLPAMALGLMAGSAAVVGHVWTVFAGFRGGKGVATAAGALAALAPAGLGIAAGVFAITLFSTGIVSLASMLGALAFPLGLFALMQAGLVVSPWLLSFACVLAPLIVFTHRSNIVRLAKGKESRFEHLILWRRLRVRGKDAPPGSR